MITIFGTTYFTIGVGLIVLALAAPLLLWLSFWLLRPNIEGKPRRVRWLAVGGTTLGVLLLAAVGLFWDVYLIGQRAKELCAESGLKIHRQVRADGFLGTPDLVFWSQQGFRYLEWEFGDLKYRIQLEDHSEKRSLVNSFQSRYELSISTALSLPNGGYIDRNVSRNVSRILDRGSGDILGELTSFSIRSGWLDRALFALTGFTSSPHVCGRNALGELVFDGDKLTSTELVLAVLKPE